jgi:hypothetical protein
MRTLRQKLAIFFREDCAQGLTEYSLLLAFLALAAAGFDVSDWRHAAGALG